ncbi:MAG: molybdopterin molybdotransferase [Thermoleophilaceae bacterium]|nr:molybdopterin molybdotransferase [Thermoleophilaceae bacterium]
MSKKADSNPVRGWVGIEKAGNSAVAVGGRRAPPAGKIARVPEPITIDDALERVLAAAEPLTAEWVPLDDALGRVLAEDAVAAEDLPPFDSSAMDGYAVADPDAGELPIAGEARAGHPFERALAPGEAIRISTGAPVPDGAVAVVPVERTEEEGERVRFERVPRGANIRRAGEDVCAGDRVIESGTDLGPAEVAMLAALGLPEVACGGVPRVAVLATGDELVAPGAPLLPGQIRDSNAYALAAQASRAGARVVMRAEVPDDATATRQALASALGLADVVCVSGGVSVGRHDHVKDALAELGVKERFWRVRLKPGKPTWFGELGEKLVFGLPGNPVSAMVTFHLFARPALRQLAGADPGDVRATALLDVPLERNPSRAQVVRCRLHTEADGWHATPTGAQGSHVLSSMLGVDAFALIREGHTELPAGSRIDIELVR